MFKLYSQLFSPCLLGPSLSATCVSNRISAHSWPRRAHSWQRRIVATECFRSPRSRNMTWGVPRDWQQRKSQTRRAHCWQRRWLVSAVARHQQAERPKCQLSTSPYIKVVNKCVFQFPTWETEVGSTAMAPMSIKRRGLRAVTFEKVLSKDVEFESLGIENSAVV